MKQTIEEGLNINKIKRDQYIKALSNHYVNSIIRDKDNVDPEIIAMMQQCFRAGAEVSEDKSKQVKDYIDRCVTQLGAVGDDNISIGISNILLQIKSLV